MKIAESEKITINLGYIDLGNIDLLVQEGFYSNRTDLIRTAIRNQLSVTTTPPNNPSPRRQLDLGLRTYTRADLQALRKAGKRWIFRFLVWWSLRRCFCGSCSCDHCLHSGACALQASTEVKAALSDRIR